MDALKKLDELTSEWIWMAALTLYDRLKRLKDTALDKWLSPQDPSSNHNIACSSHHEGTGEWFIQGSIFTEWKSTGSLLWLHGKCTFPCPF